MKILNDMALNKKRIRLGKFDERFDLAKNLDETNRFGWIVEINPFDTKSIPVKNSLRSL